MLTFGGNTSRCSAEWTPDALQNGEYEGIFKNTADAVVKLSGVGDDVANFVIAAARPLGAKRGDRSTYRDGSVPVRPRAPHSKKAAYTCPPLPHHLDEESRRDVDRMPQPVAGPLRATGRSDDD